MQDGFHESTIEATVWLICWHPERLKAWLDRHPPGDKLEAVARRRIKNPQAVIERHKARG